MLYSCAFSSYFFLVSIFLLYFHVLLKSIHSLQQLLLTYISQIFWSYCKEESLSWSWETRNYSLPCGFLVFISKLSECRQVELSAAFPAIFDKFLVSINDTVQLDVQLHFIFIVTTS